MHLYFCSSFFFLFAYCIVTSSLDFQFCVCIPLTTFITICFKIKRSPEMWDKYKYYVINYIIRGSECLNMGIGDWRLILVL